MLSYALSFLPFNLSPQSIKLLLSKFLTFLTFKEKISNSSTAHAKQKLSATIKGIFRF